MMDTSITYYNQHAKEYLEGTAGLDMQAFYEQFLPLLPVGGHILDAGCGSGRDARVFMDRGYRVTAFDASEAMVAAASERTQQHVFQMQFEEFVFEEEFDGIWACASLLHVPREKIVEVLARFVAALKPNGVWYMSFKVGEGEEMRSGRLFNCYTEASLAKLLSQFPMLSIVKLWGTTDVRANRKNDLWVNAIVQKE